MVESALLHGDFAGVMLRDGTAQRSFSFDCSQRTNNAGTAVKRQHRSHHKHNSAVQHGQSKCVNNPNGSGTKLFNTGSLVMLLFLCNGYQLLNGGQSWKE